MGEWSVGQFIDLRPVQAFAAGLPVKLLVRHEELLLWKTINDLLMLEDGNALHVTILGSRGVGKSTFLTLLAFSFVRSFGQSVALMRKSHGLVAYLLLRPDGAAVRGTASSTIQAKAVVREQQCSNASVFLDGFTASEVTEVAGSDLQFLIATSDGSEASSCNDQEGEGSALTQLVMPAWQLKDLEAFAVQSLDWMAAHPLHELGPLNNSVVRTVQDKRRRELATDAELELEKARTAVVAAAQEQYYYSGGSLRDFCRPRQELLAALEDRLERIPTTSPSSPFALMLDIGYHGSRDHDVYRHYLVDPTNSRQYADCSAVRLGLDSEWLLSKLMERGAFVSQYEPHCRFTAALNDSLYECAFSIYGLMLIRRTEESWL